MKNEFVSYLNTLHNASGCNEHAIAENNLRVGDNYSSKLLFSRHITGQIKKQLTEEEGKIIVLTGHAGDGKTSILQEIIRMCTDREMNANLTDWESILVNNKVIHYIKDMSEHEKEKQIEFFRRAFAAQKKNESTILISNTGPLFNVLLELGMKEEEIIKLLDTKDLKETKIHVETEGEIPVVLVNLALFDNSDVVETYIEKIVEPSLWSPCEQCMKKEFCPIYFNQKIVQKNKEQIKTFVTWFYRWNFEHGERFTVRQMIAHIAYSFTGNQSCEKIRKLLVDMNEKRKLYNSFSNLFFGYHYRAGKSEKDKDATQIKPITVIQKQMPDAKKLQGEYALFVQNKFHVFQDEVMALVKSCWDTYVKLDESQREEKQEIFRLIKRAYFMYHNRGEQENQNIVKELYSDVFCNFIEIQENSVAPRLAKNNLEKLVCYGLYSLFMGMPYEENENIIYLTVKRRGMLSQGVQMVKGYVNMSDLNIAFEDYRNNTNGRQEKEIILECNGQRIGLTLPMLEYFEEISKGLIQTKVDPRLSQGVENIKAQIAKAGKKIDENCMCMVYHDGNQFRKIEISIEKEKIWVG